MAQLPDLNNKAWRGIADAYGTDFVFELTPSAQHPGYYHLASFCLNDAFLDETARPIREDGLVDFVKFALKRHGLALDDITWTELAANEEKLTRKEG